ncbi:MAG: hypothetical protein K0S34_2667, partial [Bacillales bacterium]|nr:hypothetical protein [Bacillales bacterium]
LTTNYIIILEVKYIRGTIEFDEVFHQLIRTNEDGSKDVYHDPVLQVIGYQKNLYNWLFKNKYYDVPIIPLVIVAHPNSIVVTNSKNKHYINTIVRSNFLISKLENIENKYNRKVFERKDLKKLCRHLIKNNIEDCYEVLNTYNVRRVDLLSGIYCYRCKQLSVKREHGVWICTICNHINNEAYIDALNDYVYLVSDIITNKNFRMFTNVESRRVFNRITEKLNISATDKENSKSYFLPRNGFEIPKHSLEKTN